MKKVTTRRPLFRKEVHSENTNTDTAELDENENIKIPNISITKDLDIASDIDQILLKHGAHKLNYWEGESRSIGEKSYQQEGNLKPGRKRFLRPIDEFFMVMMRLQLGLLQEYLADIFIVS
ncbi:Hypothetical predicted protein [Mytilus galloprovincialis]|uniref:Uncharacterized protein n=1 Tax=Mytilus galloprovincialis TaxID=29158 RepID=A0A8B6CTE4_MYTGA|nr:Hypothetical predicted protein [Mytilus galloprovincialis]